MRFVDGAEWFWQTVVSTAVGGGETGGVTFGQEVVQRGIVEKRKVAGYHEPRGICPRIKGRENPD